MYIYHLNLLSGGSICIGKQQQQNYYCAKMKRIMNFINDIDMDQRTEAILRGELGQGDVYEKVVEFNALNIEEKQLYMMRLGERIGKMTKPYKLLTTMLLLDHISKCNPRLPFPSTFVSSLAQDSSKENVVMVNAIRYYHYFLKCNIANKFNVETVNPEDEFEEAQGFCRVALSKIIEFLKVAFVFQHGVLRLEGRKFLVKSVVRSILSRFSEDLHIINLFVKNNLEIILQKTIKHPYVFTVNHIYEQLLMVNRSLHKLEELARLVQLRAEFPRYEVDIELNRQIERIMGEKKKERELAMSELECSEKQLFHDCYLSSEREIHTTESFLIQEELSL